MARQESVGIILLNFNNHADTRECIISVLKSEYTNYHLCVVDNFSKEEDRQQLSSYLSTLSAYPNVSWIFHDKNLGFSGGNNLGIRYLKENHNPDLFWLLNNDTIINPDTLGTLVDFAQKNEGYKLIGNTLAFHHAPNTLQGIGGTYNKWLGRVQHIGEGSHLDDISKLDTSLVHYPIGASLMVKSEFIDKVGLLPEEHFLFFEEIDYTKRGQAHFKNFIGICKDAVVWHKEGASYKDGKTTERSKIADFYFVKNRIKITKKYFPEALPTIYLLSLVVVFNRLVRGQFDRVGMVLSILFGAKHP